MADGLTPGPLLKRALDHINSKVGMIQGALIERHFEHNTTILLSAKHGGR